MTDLRVLVIRGDTSTSKLLIHIIRTVMDIAPTRIIIRIMSTVRMKNMAHPPVMKLMMLFKHPTKTNTSLFLTSIDLSLTNINQTLTDINRTLTDINRTLTNISRTLTNIDLTLTTISRTLTDISLALTSINLTLDISLILT